MTGLKIENNMLNIIKKIIGLFNKNENNNVRKKLLDDIYNYLTNLSIENQIKLFELNINKFNVIKNNNKFNSLYLSEINNNFFQNIKVLNMKNCLLYLV